MRTQTLAGRREYVISEDSSERIRILKVWFIILVVFIHAYSEEIHFAEGDMVLEVPLWLQWTKYAISRVIARCAVPGFFFLSSLLLYRRDFTWADNMRKKVKGLLVPYVIITTFWIVTIFAAQHIGPLSGFVLADSVYNVRGWSWKDLLNAYAGLQGPDYVPLVYPFWFMRDLLALNLLAPAIRALIDRLPRLTLLALGLAMALDLKMPWFLSQQAVVYFFLGCYAVKYRLQLSDADRLPGLLLAAAYAAAVAADTALRGAQMQYLVRHVSIILGLLFFTRSTAWFRGGWRRLLLRLAGYSMPVYLFHELALTFLKKAAARLLPSSVPFQVLQYVGIPAVIIGGCVLGSMALKKLLPRVYAVLTGGRT